MSRWRRRPSPGEGDDEQQANLDRAADEAIKARRGRGQTSRREAAEKRAREEPQPPNPPRP